MKLRLSILLLGSALAAACGGEKADSPEISATAADSAALDKLRTDYASHYNMHHASVVADFYSDSAVYLGADGSVDEGKTAILAGLEAGMAGMPALELTTVETIIQGDHAIGRGTYTLGLTPPGGSTVSVAGNYMTYFGRENGAWRIRAVVTNYDAPPPAGLPRAAPSSEPPPPEDGTMKELANEYMTHHNMGHASVVAGLYTEDAVAAFADAKPVQGRAAIEAALTALMAEGSPQLTIHDVGTTHLDQDWAVDGGWYEIKTTTAQGASATSGAYLLLARRAEDGTWKIHRIVANGGPAAPQGR